MTLVEGVVRQRAGAPLEVVLAHPAGALAPMSRAVVEQSASAARLADGLWRLRIQTEGEPSAEVTRLGEASEAVALVRVAREERRAVVVREVLFSQGDADAALKERLSSIVSEAVAAAGSELREDEERWLDIVIAARA